MIRPLVLPLLASLLAAAIEPPALAEVKIAPPVGDGMVLQRGGKAPIFGTADAGEKISVSFRDKTYEAVADDKGAWRADLVPGEAGGPFPLVIKGKNTLELKEVYVGDVWICSGQSNMEFATANSTDVREKKLDLSTANPKLRLLKYGFGNWKVQVDPKSVWLPAGKKAVLDFSAVGYFFGAKLQTDTKVPVGLIEAAVGGSHVTHWIPPEKGVEMGLKGFGDKQPGGQWYTESVKPLQPFVVRGLLWYQGESDLVPEYGHLLTGLIEGWRKAWGRDDLVVLVVQLPSFGSNKDSTGGFALIRDVQQQALKLPGTAVVVTCDAVGGDWHPPDKRPIGERLALAARAVAGGEKIEYSGPLIESARRDGNEIVLAFTHAEGMTAKAELKEFEAQVAKANYKTVPAKVDGKTVKLDVTGLAGPLIVRYAYRDWPVINLFNKDGLPASPFVIEVK